MWAVESATQSKYIDTIKLSLDQDRPPELCTDEAKSEDVVRHHLAEQPHGLVVLLQPTSPLRTSDDVDWCIERTVLGNGCISVGPDGKPNGAVYVARSEWISKHDFSHAGLMKLYMPEERSLDIDYEADFGMDYLNAR